MKKILFVLLLLTTLAEAEAQSIANGEVAVSGLEMARNDSMLDIGMKMDLSMLDVDNNRAVVYTPVLFDEDHAVELASVGIYGRRRHIVTERNDWDVSEVTEEWFFNERRRPEVLDYFTSLPYQEWMNGARLRVERRLYGCCNRVLAMSSDMLGGYEEWVYEPVFIYVQPEVELEKRRHVASSAYIDFPVSQTVIRNNYRNNSEELAAIAATIDSIRNDSDINILSLNLKGFASPEGPYDNNARLAEGRTRAVREYVMNLYDFPAEAVTTSFEPENWEGLEAWLDTTAIANREAILDIVNGPLAPDARNDRIMTEFPAEYAILLHNCYPALRRTDYRVEYVIRNFSDPEEIALLVASAPQKLSLQEFYIASLNMDEGSEEFGNVFETAVRMYPDDETANLNAANSAMSKGNLSDAERYLQKAGDSDEAIYARGVYAMLTGNHDAAREFFGSVRHSLREAEREVRRLERGARRTYRR